MNGRELAQRAGRMRPEMRVLYMSGYTEDVIDRHLAFEPGFALLQGRSLEAGASTESSYKLAKRLACTHCVH